MENQTLQNEQTANSDLGAISKSLFDKGRMLVEANIYADKCVRLSLFGKDKEIARQRLIVLYLLDEIDRLSKQ